MEWSVCHPQRWVTDCWSYLLCVMSPGQLLWCYDGRYWPRWKAACHSVDFDLFRKSLSNVLKRYTLLFLLAPTYCIWSVVGIACLLPAVHQVSVKLPHMSAAAQTQQREPIKIGRTFIQFLIVLCCFVKDGKVIYFYFCYRDNNSQGSKSVSIFFFSNL